MKAILQRIRGWQVAALLTLACAACASLQVGSDYDRAAEFSSYHTFTLMRRDDHGAHNPLVVQRAEDAIRQDLISRGYTPASNGSNADFAVDFTIGSRERTDVTSYPAPYSGPWWGGGWWWGRGYWGNNLDVRQVREGTLSIDVFDGRTHRPVWHGWAKKQLTRSDMEHSEEPIRRAVRAVLEKFPPGGTGAAYQAAPAAAPGRTGQ